MKTRKRKKESETETVAQHCRVNIQFKTNKKHLTTKYKLDRPATMHITGKRSDKIIYNTVHCIR